MDPERRRRIRDNLILGVEFQPGELRSVAAMFAALFLLLQTVYLLKPAREMLILTEGTAEVRSYAVALQALLLLVIIPIYARYCRRYPPFEFMRGVIVCAAAILVLFYIGGKLLGYPVSVPFFTFLGAYSVMMVAQFWALASELYSREAGERLFAAIAFGATAGAWAGSVLTGLAVNWLDAYDLMLVAVVGLLLSYLPIGLARRWVPERSRCRDPQVAEDASLLAGFRLIVGTRYLWLIALFVVLLNWVNSSGDYLISLMLERNYAAGVVLGDIEVDKGTYVGRFFSHFYFIVNICTVLIQYFLVARLLKYAGFNVAFVMAPLLVFLGYASLALMPVIALFRVVKVTENSLDYSLLTTTRQMLYLPLGRQQKYEVRAVIDSFGSKLGDMLQALMVFVGVNLFAMGPEQFLPLIVLLAGLTLVLAWQVVLERGRHWGEPVARGKIALADED